MSTKWSKLKNLKHGSCGPIPFLKLSTLGFSREVHFHIDANIPPGIVDRSDVLLVGLDTLQLLPYWSENKSESVPLLSDINSHGTQSVESLQNCFIGQNLQMSKLLFLGHSWTKFGQVLTIPSGLVVQHKTKID